MIIRKATVRLPGEDLKVSLEIDNDSISDHFGELELTDNCYVKQMLRDSENGIFIDTDMVIYCVISTDYQSEDLYAIFGCYLEHYTKFDGYRGEYKPYKRHDLIMEQIEDFMEYHSKLAIGDIARCYVVIETRPVTTEVIEGNMFARSQEFELYDTCGNVEIDFSNDDYSNVIEIIGESAPPLTDGQLEEIESQLRVSE